jgi:ABC-type amino acid transport substrate-binding protein
MENRFSIAALFLFLVSPIASARAADPVTLKLYDPSGAFEVQQVFAPRVSDLSGKTVCELSDSAWEDNRTFPLIRSLLQDQFPTAKFIPYTDFPHDMRAAGGGFAIDQDATANMVKQKGCQAVIVGNAG